MLVSQILRSKGDTVFTVTPTETIAAVASLLHTRRVGALVVLDAERVAGIVSERDVVRGLAEGGAAALGKPVSSIMTKDGKPVTEGKIALQAEAAEMWYRNIEIKLLK